MTKTVKIYIIGLCAALLVMGAAGFHSAAHGAADSSMVTPPTCEIRGTVSEVSVKKSLIPSPIVDSETHISVNVAERKARYGNDIPCADKTASSAQETRTYKLCSKSSVQTGDTINGTEASATGPASPVGCLFDLVVVAHKN